MCNAYRLRQPPSVFTEEFSQLRLPLVFADGQVPNLEPRDQIRIRDTAPIVGRDGDGVQLSMTQWAWVERGRPVFNFRSEGRNFANSDRRLIPADGFYEFTDPEDPRQKRKDKWLFTLAGEPWFWIAGILRDGCFTMLTTEPGEDIMPYHNRQIVVLPRRQGLAWLDLTVPQEELLRPLPAGALDVVRTA